MKNVRHGLFAGGTLFVPMTGEPWDVHHMVLELVQRQPGANNGSC